MSTGSEAHRAASAAGHAIVAAVSSRSRSSEMAGRQRSGPGARLTGGEACGRKLLTVSGDGLRASTGVVRAACFNILGESVMGANVVDLFAGAGSLGLEALSRGASRATFVELRRDRAAVIQQNVDMLGYSGSSEVVVADVIPWLRASAPRLTEVSLLLMDPPYLAQGPALCTAALARLGALAGQEMSWQPTVVVEHLRRFPLPEVAGALNCVRHANYGSTQLSFYRRQS